MQFFYVNQIFLFTALKGTFTIFYSGYENSSNMQTVFLTWISYPLTCIMSGQFSTIPKQKVAAVYLLWKTKFFVLP